MPNLILDKNGTGNNGTGKNCTGKNCTVMLNFPKPELEPLNPKPKLSTPHPNLNIENVPFLPTLSFVPFLPVPFLPVPFLPNFDKPCKAEICSLIFIKYEPNKM